MFDTRALDMTQVVASILAGLFVLLFVEVEKALFRRWLYAGQDSA